MLLDSTDALTAAAAAPIITGLVEAAKRAGLPPELAGLAAVVIGIPIVVLLAGDADLPAIVTGLVAGLTAAGLYSQAKPLMERSISDAAAD